MPRQTLLKLRTRLHRRPVTSIEKLPLSLTVEIYNDATPLSHGAGPWHC